MPTLSAAPRRRASRFLATLALFSALAAPLAAQAPYKLPPKQIVNILDALPLPQGQLSPDRQWLLLEQRPSMPTIADMSEPMYRLAGNRIAPATNGPGRTNWRILSLSLERVSDGAKREIETPEGAMLGWPSWSPDGKRVAFTRTTGDGIELWVADAAAGRAHRLGEGRLNATGPTPCRWTPDSAHLLCLYVPDGRGAEPQAPKVPIGPVVQETKGHAAPARTYEDLLETPHDEQLYDYYFTSQLALVDAATGERTSLGAPAVFAGVEPSPDGRYLLVTRTVRPYSYLVPDEDFPKVIEVWTAAGEVVKKIAELPLAETTPIRGVRTGPRDVAWRPDAPATLVWAEALDGGDPRRKADYRDHVVALAAPFTGEPAELVKLADRYAGTVWAQPGLAIVTDFNWDKRWSRTWMVSADHPATAPRKLWDRSAEDRYGDPGSIVTRPGEGSGGSFRRTSSDAVAEQNGDWVYLEGDGAGPTGERPFLDRLSLKTLKTERLWRSDPAHYESVVALLDDGARRVLTRRESATEPPNYFVRAPKGGAPRALTAFKDPAPEFTAGIQKKVVVYKRDDGVQLSGTLYLPPGYQEGMRLPAVIWAYPREFVSRAAASQVVGSSNRFTFFRGPSQLFFLTQGYVVFDGPTMPILGGDTANNHYVEQLVASAKAAVDELVSLGVADRDRIGVGGHSYGAFMTANLLAHSDLFRAGIARSGAYNRTLTPFGFQNERRTFWQVPEIYARMSPFFHADSVNEPLLMTHGMADDNSGTFPIQSERFYAALKGLGKTVRFVYLPHEAHGYAARESVLDVVAEMLDWFDTYVKHAPPRTAATSDR